MNNIRKFAVVAASGFALLAAPSAEAQNVPSLSATICATTDLDGFTLTDFLVNPLTCASFSGNNSGSNQSAWLGDNYFPDGWTDLGTTNANESTGPFEEYMPSDGSFSLNSSFSPLTGAFSIILKGGNGFSVYNFNTAESIVRFEYTNGGMGGSGLSHVSLWKGPSDCVQTQTCDPVFVPEPASIALLASGLFGLGIIARRRRES